jgi:hypothetical protein
MTAKIIAVKAIIIALSLRIHAYADATEKDDDGFSLISCGNPLPAYQRLREHPAFTGYKK